jgi:TATA-box binding protein (TBP) (component of TFIID and TFIIIB)
MPQDVSMSQDVQAQEVKISTITACTQIPNCILNLTNIGKYLEIDSQIIGIKYKYADLNVMKGKYSTTIYKKSKVKDVSKINQSLFYNQITIIVNNGGNHVNVKLFGNGSCHMTGLKGTDEAKDVTALLFQKLQSMQSKSDRVLLTKDENGVYLDKDNLIYGCDSKQVIGYSKNGLYIIRKREYEIDAKTGMFLCKKMELKRSKVILNFNGDEIGSCRIEMLKNKTKFYKKNANIFIDYDKGFIYYNNNVILGKIVYEIDDIKITNKTLYPNVCEAEYSCNPFVNQFVFDAQDVTSDINCMNIYFNLGYKLNRQRLHDKLMGLRYICKYKPESYSGIKMIYKIPIKFTTTCDGFCKCTTKCTCTNITFLIFQSGNVIATGFKSQEQIDYITSMFFQLCNENENHIRTKCVLSSQ